MSWALHSAVWYADALTISSRAACLLARLADLSDDQGKPLVIHSQKALAKSLRCSESTLKRSLAELEKRDLISRTRCGPEKLYRNRYVINVLKLIGSVPPSKRFGPYKNWDPNSGEIRKPSVHPDPYSRSAQPLDGFTHGPTDTFSTFNKKKRRNTNNTDGRKAKSGNTIFDDMSEARRNSAITEALISWLMTGASAENDLSLPYQESFTVSLAATTAARYALWALKGTVSATGGASGQRVSDIADALNGPNGGEVRKRCQQLIEACGLEMPRKHS